MMILVHYVRAIIASHHQSYQQIYIIIGFFFFVRCPQRSTLILITSNPSLKTISPVHKFSSIVTTTCAMYAMHTYSGTRRRIWEDGVGVGVDERETEFFFASVARRAGVFGRLCRFGVVSCRCRWWLVSPAADDSLLCRSLGLSIMCIMLNSEDTVWADHR